MLEAPFNGPRVLLSIPYRILFDKVLALSHIRIFLYGPYAPW